MRLSHFVKFLALCLLSPFVHAEVTNISNAELAAMATEDVTIIDVRRPDEWKHSGIIEGSHPVMFFDRLGRYNIEDWLQQVDAIVARDQPIALICARGVRSSNIARLLDEKLGYSKVFNVTDGMIDWVEGGRPVTAWKP